MDQVFTYIGNHPFLVGIFAVLLILFIRNEMQRGGASLTAQEVVNLVNNDGALVIDVRDKSEYDEGHIVDAINIPFANLQSRIDEIKKYKEKPVIIACKMGQHSGTAGSVLMKEGFTDVRRLKGGITEWRGQSLPVVKA